MAVSHTQFTAFKKKFQTFVEDTNLKFKEYIEDSDEEESIGNSISGSEPNQGLDTIGVVRSSSEEP